MKIIRLFITLSFVLFIGVQQSEAQFLKKLSQKVEKKVEEKVIEKAANKAEKETENTMDKVLEPDEKTTKGNNRKTKSSALLKSSYEFSYQYQLTIKTKEGNVTMDYYIQPNQDSYLGSKMNAEGFDMFIIMENEQSHVFMDMGGMKMVQTTDTKDSEFGNESFRTGNYKITELPNKTILGYDCKGLQMEDDNYSSTVYYTNDAPVSMTNVFNSDQQIPESVKKYFSAKSLMMSMEITDKKGKGKNDITGFVECTLIKENNFSFSTQGYNKRGF